MLFDNIQNNKIIVPPIKCQGIKTDLVEWIKSKINFHYNTWYEPFCGTCVVGFNVRPQKAIFSDNNPHLINFYQAIKNKTITYNAVKDFLETEGDKLFQSNGEYYYDVRNRFNNSKNPLDFLFLNRACFNGLIRFNSKGGFNTPFCRKPNRFAKSYITKITNQVKAVSEIILDNDYDFIYQDFTQTIKLTNENDLIYCDPPYIDRHADYFTSWNLDNEKMLYRSLKESNVKFILSNWHSDRFRKNEAIETIWNEFAIDTKEHFYFVGGKKGNRHSVSESLIYNISI